MKNIITLTLSLFICLIGFSQNTIFTEGFEVPFEESGWTTGMSTDIQDSPTEYPGGLDPWEMWDLTTEPTYVHSGNSAAFIGGSLTLEDKYDWLISPGFTVPTDATTEINYWMWYYSADPSYWTWLYIMIYDVAEDSWEIGELILHEEAARLYYSEEYTFDASPWEGKEIKVAFVKRGTNQFAMDDISCISVDHGNDLAVVEIQSPSNQTGCILSAEEDVIITIENSGTTTINSFEVSYSIDNQVVATESVNETINVGETLDYTFIEKADLSEFGEYTIDVEVIVENDQNASNNTRTQSVESKDAEIIVEFMTDNYQTESSWQIMDENNNIIATNGELERMRLHSDRICVLSTGCYTFALTDSFGDGVSDPAGYLSVYYNGDLVGGFNEDEANFGYEFVIDFIGDGCDTADIDSVTKESVKAYPNPVTDVLFLENLTEGHAIRLFDTLGREYSPTINSVANNATINFSNLQTGIYLVKITSPNGSDDTILIQKQ